MTISDLCVLTHATEPDRPRLALDGLRLCHGHHRELEQRIAELPSRYDDLDRATSPGGTGGPGGGSHPGLDIDEAAAELRSQIRHDLLWWARYVADTRGIGRPGREDPFTTAAWLTIHIDWLAANEYAATNMLPVLRELTGRTYGIADVPARVVELGTQCLTHTGGQRCIGIVTLIVRGDDWTATCPACRERSRQEGELYVPQDATPYLRIARRGQWITAAEVIHLAALFGIPANVDVLYQWKRRGHIRGRVGLWENEYDLRSVQRYLARRQAETRRISA